MCAKISRKSQKIETPSPKTRPSLRTRLIDAAGLKKRVADFWGNATQRQLLRENGVEFSRLSPRLSFSKLLKTEFASSAIDLLSRPASAYRLRRSMSIKGALVVAAQDDGKPLPSADKLVVITRTISVFEQSENRAVTEVLILERQG